VEEEEEGGREALREAGSREVGGEVEVEGGREGGATCLWIPRTWRDLWMSAKQRCRNSMTCARRRARAARS
jgi:hypothetical protein